MPSSTSSSEAGAALREELHVSATHREIPQKPWLRMFAVALVIVAAAAGLWERQVRAWGYGPSYDDTPAFWAERRALAEGVGPEQIVFVGTSRTLFDMDLEVFRAGTGGPMPIQLATVGSNPIVVLSDLAADESYAGTTIVDITPGLAMAAGGPPIATPTKFVTRYHAWSPADRVELPMALWLQARLAFLNQDDLTLAALLENELALPNRPDAYAPKLPDYMLTLDRDRCGRMADMYVHDPQRTQTTQQTWMVLCTPPPKPSVFSDEEWADMMKQGAEANFARFAAAVKAIEARGGRVIFQRLPSTDRVLEIERERFPREQVWDRLLRETGAPGFHFEDYAQLRDFDCPEWSHLSAPDATEYSRRVLAIMQDQGVLPRAH